MGKTLIEPKCGNNKCFACEDGKCRALIDNDFGNKPCPFFKTRAQLAREERRRAERGIVL